MKAVIHSDEPRCEQPMQRRERSGGPPVVEQPFCGRRKGHRPPHRSFRSYRLQLDGRWKRGPR
jgi:hypothetical protein